jgi:hypothetical protein
MNIIPLVKMKKRKVFSSLSEKEVFEKINENQRVYILDLDGIDKDKPNLCTFQRISGDYELWVDYGPRNLGDVVDMFMAGAERVTIRSPLWPKLNIPDIREISENKIFLNIDIENLKDSREFSYQASDGLVNFNSKEKIESNFIYGDYLRDYGINNEIYSYENDSKNINYWQMFGVKTLLVDIEKYEDFKKWIQKQK